MHFLSIPTIIAIIGFAFCGVVQAHPGHYHPEEEIDEFEDDAYRQAVTHPFRSADHLVVMLAVGGLAFMMGGKSGAALGMTFVGALELGLISGMEIHILLVALIVILAGMLLLSQSRLAKASLWCLVAVIGFWQGCSHGVEFNGFGLCVGSATGLTLGALLASALRSLGFGQRLQGQCN